MFLWHHILIWGRNIKYVCNTHWYSRLSLWHYSFTFVFSYNIIWQFFVHTDMRILSLEQCLNAVYQHLGICSNQNCRLVHLQNRHRKHLKVIHWYVFDETRLTCGFHFADMNWHFKIKIIIIINIMTFYRSPHYSIDNINMWSKKYQIFEKYHTN